MHHPTRERVAPVPARRRTLLGQLVDLVSDPVETFPELFMQRGALRLFMCPAFSGIFVAYTLAKGMTLGEQLSFGLTWLLIVPTGTLIGVAALWVAGTLPNWRSMPAEKEGGERARMYIVFSYATWPFLPLLLITVSIELVLFGRSVFAAARPEAPADIIWALRAFVFGTILLWTMLMVSGTALVRRESEGRAAREVVAWTSKLLAIALLLAVIVIIWLRSW